MTYPPMLFAIQGAKILHISQSTTASQKPIILDMFFQYDLSNRKERYVKGYLLLFQLPTVCEIRGKEVETRQYP